jgi:hypothetical protein
METSWIYSWNRNGWEQKRQDVQFGEKELRYASSDNFTRRGVSVGDTLFVVSVRGGNLYLGGKIEVAEVLPREEAASALGSIPRISGGRLGSACSRTKISSTTSGRTCVWTSAFSRTSN